MADQPLFDLSSFHPAPGITHVCTAGDSLPLRAHSDALSRYMTDKAGGHKGYEDQGKLLDKARTLIASSWKVSSKEIGFTSSVAEGVSMILESLDWAEGDNVCIDADEYPSLVAPFALKSQRSQDSSSHRTPEMRYCTGGESMNTIVNNKTRLIAVSYVSYLNGARVDLSFYRALADSVGAILLVDFTQAAGYSPIHASVADFAFSACYKWLLGTTGTAIAFWNQQRQPNWTPGTAGWYSLSMGVARPRWETDRIDVRDDAMCFSRGSPAYLSTYILVAGVEYLDQWATSDIEVHVQTLTTKLLKELERVGIHSTTPRSVERHGASVAVDCAGASEIVDELHNSGIYASNGKGRVRFSFHGYNSVKDVERIMQVFPGLWKKWN
ncbi:pyridoxal phosphate-dependent transferase [Aspergillus pseudonomiae]|uniref:Pyridoxal phosphate-dependent transferase n=1 Tax=Aspergillus pseudonomiae TaxID=1506151 RepID=A0A5N7CWY7_9EURO|nr:pyridoxal phosphate-dependent transferase [Aspergillus pseudonomiae]KAE8398479.1 pyridoxal phosphate-dependent transferase [Aspergillus pseudonomiae]